MATPRAATTSTSPSSSGSWTSSASGKASTSQDSLALQRIKEAAEKARSALGAMETEVNQPFITSDANGPKASPAQAVAPSSRSWWAASSKDARAVPQGVGRRQAVRVDIHGK